ncbi:MAG: GWxTD domain-containing protein [Acidobacteriota bacterium]|nr:GWxTD domain-containing protein [Acidobacteriota bacterium]
MRVKLFIVAAVVMIAGIAEAGISKAAQEWRRGPERFIMSNEEEKAWKAVGTDAAAAAFIDLFWARRDPTAGTPRNEFREEFLRRVQYSNASFVEKRNPRGSLTERGQAYILLGPPENGTRQNMSVAGTSGLSSASARSVDSLFWEWSREVATSLGVPRISATFNQVINSDMYTRDTKRGTFSNVSEKAIAKNIVHPEMNAAPDWALRVSNEVFSGAASSAQQASGKAVGRIGRLVLLADLGALNLDADADPIASLQPAGEFAEESDLAYVLEYCGTLAPLKIEMKVGNMAAASELEPAPMKAVAGCGAIPGMLSLSGLKPGSHEVVITTIEPNGGRLTTKQRFQIK